MFNENKIKALIELLDDEDEIVWKSSLEELHKIDATQLEQLNNLLNDLQFTDIQYARVLSASKKIKFDYISNQLVDWKNNHTDNLVKALAIICNIKYDDITENSINLELEKLRLDAWLEFHYDLTAFEKVKIINYILFQLHGFKGDEINFLHPDNSFINKVIENKKGNPISLSIIYLLVAQRLKLPIFGVNLPNHFILTYLDLPEDENFVNYSFNEKELTENETIKEPLFYINAFNGGGVFGKEQLEIIIKQMQLPNNEKHKYACSNLDIIIRVLKNIYNSYLQFQPSDAEYIKTLIDKLTQD
jgi:regulator of sirC expression with transglutaminase-like and TPR domain